MLDFNLQVIKQTPILVLNAEWMEVDAALIGKTKHRLSIETELYTFTRIKK